MEATISNSEFEDLIINIYLLSARSHGVGVDFSTLCFTIIKPNLLLNSQDQRLFLNWHIPQLLLNMSWSTWVHVRGWMMLWLCTLFCLNQMPIFWVVYNKTCSLKWTPIMTCLRKRLGNLHKMIKSTILDSTMNHPLEGLRDCLINTRILTLDCAKIANKNHVTYNNSIYTQRFKWRFQHHLLILLYPKTLEATTTFWSFSKVDVPNLVTYLSRTPIYKWNVIGCGSKNKKTPKNTCALEYRSACSKYDYHLRLGSQGPI